MLEHLKKDPCFRTLRKKRIGVLMGGRSAEREVSLMSGRGVMASLKRLGFDCVAVDAMSGLERKITDLGVQIAFTALHGRWGEDGSVQGLLEYMNVPYTGSGVHASALAMNKISAKRIFQAAGVPTAPFAEIDTEGDLNREARKCAALGFPLIVKPNDEGSSIGCHIVKNRGQLVRAVKKERRQYPKMFVEKYVRGRELTVGIIQQGGRNRVLPVLELLPKRDFYDYKAKYQEGLTDFIIPARIPAPKRRRVMALALRAHELLNCHGVSRTDFILDKKTGVPYCLELNTLPGLTPLSDIPAQARAAGITYDELIYHILASALTSKRSMKRAIYHD